MTASTNAITSSLNINGLVLPNRLIQGPLAGFSCAPFRTLFSLYHAPAYCVSEMISAHDVLHKHTATSRYLWRDPRENILCYQLAGHEPETMALAAVKLAQMGADIIDINCGCPKAKIRKKRAGSALLEEPSQLIAIVQAMRQAITIPLTVKIRLQGDERDLVLAQALQKAGSDALIVHGRRWFDDYQITVNYSQIARIKQAVTIPVIANGDIDSKETLDKAIQATQCDAFMISRAGTGHPTLYGTCLTGQDIMLSTDDRIDCFMQHLQGLAQLESPFKAMLQSKTLVRYYFKEYITPEQLLRFYALESLIEIEAFCQQLVITR